MARSGGDQKKPGDVKTALAELSGEERDRLIRALAELMIEEIKESRRIDVLRRLER